MLCASGVDAASKIQKKIQRDNKKEKGQQVVTERVEVLLSTSCGFFLTLLTVTFRMAAEVS